MTSSPCACASLSVRHETHTDARCWKLLISRHAQKTILYDSAVKFNLNLNKLTILGNGTHFLTCFISKTRKYMYAYSL